MAGEVSYKINGVSFKTNGAYVMQSHGLVDRPARKPVLSYEWPDEDGTVYDLEEKPKYKERKIALDIIVIGDNWSDIETGFNAIMDEFDKAGTQTLKVKPFNYTEMEFEVIIDGETKLDKQFKDGTMYGIFTLNMIEPEPKINE